MVLGWWTYLLRELRGLLKHLPGGGVLKWAACSHMLSTVCFVTASGPPQWKSMFRWELISSPWTGLGFFDVAHSLFIPNYQCTVNLSECVKKKKKKQLQFCIRGERVSVSGRILVKWTVLTLHDPITSARRLSFQQNCHHYCIFCADKSVCLCSGDLSHMCVTYTLPIFQQVVSINTFNQKHTWPDLRQAFQHHSEHTLDIAPLSIPVLT